MAEYVTSIADIEDNCNRATIVNAVIGGAIAEVVMRLNVASPTELETLFGRLRQATQTSQELTELLQATTADLNLLLQKRWEARR